MSQAKGVFTKALLSMALLGVGAAGIATLAIGLATAAPKKKPPGPLCGPTILYECTFRDGSTQFVGLTACEVDRYEKKNKATCEPSGG